VVLSFKTDSLAGLAFVPASRSPFQSETPSDFNGITLLQPFKVDGFVFFVARNSINRLVLCIQDSELQCVGKPCSHAFVQSPMSRAPSAANADQGFWSLAKYDFIQTAHRWIDDQAK
jgi:hypothetical protein